MDLVLILKISEAVSKFHFGCGPLVSARACNQKGVAFSSTRCVWAWLVAFFAVLLAGAVAAADAQQVNTASSDVLSVSNVRVGYSGRYRSGRLTPLFVRLVNPQNSAVNAQLRLIHSDSDGDNVEWIADAPLGPSQDRLVTLMFRPTEQMFYSRSIKLAVGLVDGDNFEPVNVYELTDSGLSKIGGLRVEVISPETIAVAVIGNSTGALAAAASDSAHEGLRPLDVFAVASSSLPGDWRALDMLDVIFWQDPDMNSVSPETQEAISQWVRRGGRLVMALGPHSMTLNAARDSFKRILPVRVVKSSVQIDDCTELVKLLVGNSDMSIDKSAFVSEIRVTKGAVLARGGKLPLMCRSQCVGGEVSVLAGRIKDFKLDSIPVAVFREGAMRRLLGFDNKMFDNSPELRILNIDSALRPPAISGLLISLAIIMCFVYVVLAGPVSWFVLKRKHATHLAWWVFAVVAVVASGVFAVMARFGLSEPAASVVAVVDVENKSSFANIRGYCGIYLPRHGTAQVSLSDDYYASLSPLVDDDFNSLSGYADVRKYTLDKKTPHTISPFFRRTVKRMAFNYCGGIDGDIAADFVVSPVSRPATGQGMTAASLANWQLSGVVDNSFGYKLHNAVLIYNIEGLGLVAASLGDIDNSSKIQFHSHAGAPYKGVRLANAKEKFKTMSMPGLMDITGRLNTYELVQAGSCASLLSADMRQQLAIDMMDMNMTDRSDLLESGYAILMARITEPVDLLPVKVDDAQLDITGDIIIRTLVPLEFKGVVEVSPTASDL